MSGINLRYSQGRTLVELMIAMTIGLVISLAVTSLFVNNSQTYRIFDDKAVMEEDGRFALNMLAYHIRMAGTGPSINTTLQTESGGGVSSFDPSTGEAIFGCSGGFLSPVAAANPALAFPVPCNSSATGPDGLVIRYVVDLDNSNQASASLVAPTDCLGQPVALSMKTPPLQSDYTVENRYYVVVDPVTSRSDLYCVGNGDIPLNTAPLKAGKRVMANVIDMKVIYGYDQQNKQSANSFFNAADLMAPTVPIPANESLSLSGAAPSKWSRIVSAKICLVMRSASDALAPKPMTYTDCSGTVVAAADKRLYSTFSTVVSIRGRINGRSL